MGRIYKWGTKRYQILNAKSPLNQRAFPWSGKAADAGGLCIRISLAASW